MKWTKCGRRSGSQVAIKVTAAVRVREMSVLRMSHQKCMPVMHQSTARVGVLERGPGIHFNYRDLTSDNFLFSRSSSIFQYCHLFHFFWSTLSSRDESRPGLWPVILRPQLELRTLAMTIALPLLSFSPHLSLLELHAASHASSHPLTQEWATSKGPIFTFTHAGPPGVSLLRVGVIHCGEQCSLRVYTCLLTLSFSSHNISHTT